MVGPDVELNEYGEDKGDNVIDFQQQASCGGVFSTNKIQIAPLSTPTSLAKVLVSKHINETHLYSNIKHV